MRFEELYKHELEQRERLRSALNLPLGLLVVVGGLFGIMLQSLWFEVSVLSILFYAAALGGVLFFSQTMYFLVRSYHGHIYKAMPFALEQRTYREGLREWHTKYGNGPDEGDREWVEYLERLYAEAADHNAGMNLIKSDYLFRANGAIIKCVICAVLAFVLFATHRALSPAAPQRIEIVGRPELK